ERTALAQRLSADVAEPWPPRPTSEWRVIRPIPESQIQRDLLIQLLGLVGRSIRVRRAHSDGWIHPQAFFEISSDLHHRVRYPTVVDQDVTFFLEVGKQIDDLRDWKYLRRVEHVHLPNQVHFPVPPFHGVQAVGNICDETLTI